MCKIIIKPIILLLHNERLEKERWGDIIRKQERNKVWREWQMMWHVKEFVVILIIISHCNLPNTPGSLFKLYIFPTFVLSLHIFCLIVDEEGDKWEISVKYYQSNDNNLTVDTIYMMSSTCILRSGRQPMVI